MICTTCHEEEVTKHTVLKVCNKCYKKSHYDETFKSMPRKQIRGTSEGTWTRCWRKDCKKRFKAKPWQDLKYSLCPKCKREADEIGVGLEWVEKQSYLRRIK